MRRRLSPFGGGVFDPTALPGYVPSAYSIAALRAAGKLWQDLAQTTPAVANTDPVRRIVVGTGVNWDAPSDAARPTLVDRGGGKWSLRFDGVADQIVGAATWSNTLASAAIQFTSVAGTIGLWCSRSGTAGTQDLYAFSGQSYVRNFLAARVNTFANTPAPSSYTNYIQVSGLSAYKTYVNGSQVGSNGAVNWEAPNQIQIGVSGATFTAFDMAGFVITAAEFSATDVTNVATYMGAL